MKAVILTKASDVEINNMIRCIGKTPYTTTDTSRCSKSNIEVACILEEIRRFSTSGDGLLFVRFSGKDDVAQEAGDESCQMCITITSDKKSKYYNNEDPIILFSKMLQLFKRGD